MAILNKAVSCLAAAVIVSTSTLGIAAAAVALPQEQTVNGNIPYVANTQAHVSSMTLDIDLTPYLFADTNESGFTDAGDTVNYTLKVTNTSDKNYNYVDASGFRLGLERFKLADSLKAGESLTKEMTYVIRADDHLEAATTVGGELTVNVRDDTQLEASNTGNLYLNAELYDCAKSTEIVDNLINYCIDGTNQAMGSIDSSNGYAVYDVATDKYYVSYASDVERFLEASGKVAEVAEEGHGVYVNPGNRVYSSVLVTNYDVEDFTVADVAHAYGLADNNVVGATVKAGETANLYFSETVDRDAMDWRLQNTVSGGVITTLDIVGGKVLTGNIGSSHSGAGAGVSNAITSENTDNNDGTFDVVWTYTATNTREATLIPRAFVSERFGSFDVTETFDNGPITQAMPVLKNVPEYTVAEEKGYVITYGKYFGSLVPQPRYESVFMGMSFVPTPELPIDPIEPEPEVPVTPEKPIPEVPKTPETPIVPEPVTPVVPVTPITPIIPEVPVTPIVPIVETPIAETPEPRKFINTGAVASNSDSFALFAMLVGGLATGLLAFAITGGKLFRKRRAAHRA